MLDNLNSKYNNNKITFYFLLLVWIINLLSINTGFYSVKNFYYNFNFNEETFVNFINTLRWFGSILILPILIKLFLNVSKTDLFSKVIIFWTVFQLIYVFFLERDPKILEINSPQVIDTFNLLINYLVTILLFIYLENKNHKQLSIFFYILVFFLLIIGTYFFYKIIISAIYNQSLVFYHSEVLDPANVYFDQPVPRITGLSRILVVIFIVFFLLKNFKFQNLYIKIILSLILFFISLLIFISQTRGSLVGISLFSVFYLFFVNKNFFKKIFQILLLVIIPFIFTQYLFNLESQKSDRETNRILKTFIVLLDNDFEEKKSKIKKEKVLEAVSEPSEYSYSVSSGRIQIWKTSLGLVFDNKKIFGFGPQGDRYALSIIAKNFNEASWQNNASNSLIYSITSTGVVGFFCIFLIYFSLAKILFKTFIQNYNNPNQDCLVLISTSIILFILARSLFENSFTVFGLDYCLLISSYFLLRSKLN